MKMHYWVALSLAGFLCPGASAAVSAEEAAKLKSTLTPFGAEKAANQDGSIPAWNGGRATPPAGYVVGAPRPDPDAGEQPALRITAKNMAQYKSRLSDGTQEMLRRYDTYHLNVYPTHRTAAAPQWVYDNTSSNATRARLSDSGNVEQAYGGIPFPIPRTGAEAMWNHLLRWRGVSLEGRVGGWIVGTDGRPVLAVKVNELLQFPYYDPEGSLEGFSGDYLVLRTEQTDPPFKAGESVLVRDSLDQAGRGRQAWQYLVGQRRVRRAPTIGFDTPDSVASGANYFDEVHNFGGSLERYDWKLQGKREMYIPYNNERLFLAAAEQVVQGRHIDPERLRWELHRVWVVEATVADGKRHAIPRRTFYLDEDTWSVVLVDGYDAQGALWRTQHALPMMAPDIPAMLTNASVIYNLQANTWFLSAFPTEPRGANLLKPVPRRPDAYFTPDALAGASSR